MKRKGTPFAKRNCLLEAGKILVIEVGGDYCMKCFDLHFPMLVEVELVS